MKKIKFFISAVIMCIFSILNAQVYQLDYQFGEYIAIFNKQTLYNTTLEYDVKNDKSLYTVIKINQGTKTGMADDNTIVLGSKKLDNELVYSDFKTSDMVIQEQIDIEMMNFVEKIPTIKWNLINETKTENNLKLNKATTTFRGRNYTVWYTLDIPVNVGPWKLHGLPGAIVTVEEDNGRYTWQLTGVKKLENSTIKNPLENKSYKVKEIKDYPELKFEVPPRIKAKLNNLGFNNSKGVGGEKRERIDLELLFEWEK